MAYIEIVLEDATGPELKENYEFISGSYSKMAGSKVPTPQVYRSSSLIPAYFNFGAMQNRVLTNDGAHDRPSGSLPGIMVNFAVSLYSSCFY
jgi:hypothetical protein